MINFLHKQRLLRKMRIVSNGHPALRKKSEPIEEITESIRELAQRMALTMLKNEVVGVGIAAPQVGINLRLIVVKTTGDDGRSRKDALPGELLLDPLMPVALVNPEIISSSGETDTSEEGCLSLPGVSGNVTRPSRVVLRAQMLDGKTVTAECGGLLARCLQHEIDHLDGILFYDHLSPEEQAKNAPTMKKLEKREQAHLH
jgi:peptide deformylase